MQLSFRLPQTTRDVPGLVGIESDHHDSAHNLAGSDRSPHGARRHMLDRGRLMRKR
jgi:hypothetical protein